MKAWIYFLQAGTDGPIKIGRAQDPIRRAGALNVGSPIELVLLGAMPSDRAAVDERKIHRRLAPHRVRGEWFHAAVVRAYMRRHRQRLWTPKKMISAKIKQQSDGRTCIFSVRLRPRQWDVWKAAAERANQTLSEWLCEAADIWKGRPALVSK
jgi:hypothetical protein